MKEILEVMEHFFALEASQQENALKVKYESKKYENLWILERVDCI
jgi:hypothetical protein